MKFRFLLAFLVLFNCNSSVLADSHVCKVETVIDGDTFVCAGGLKIDIWGIEAPQVAPIVSEEEAEKNGGNKAKEYLTSYIKGKELTCTIRGMRKDGVVAQCINDLQVKSYDIAVPLYNGKYVEELQEVTKGYYRDKKYPRSH